MFNIAVSNEELLGGVKPTPASFTSNQLHAPAINCISLPNISTWMLEYDSYLLNKNVEAIFSTKGMIEAIEFLANLSCLSGSQISYAAQNKYKHLEIYKAISNGIGSLESKIKIKRNVVLGRKHFDSVVKSEKKGLEEAANKALKYLHTGLLDEMTIVKLSKLDSLTIKEVNDSVVEGYGRIAPTLKIDADFDLYFDADEWVTVSLSAIDISPIFVENLFSSTNSYFVKETLHKTLRLIIHTYGLGLMGTDIRDCGFYWISDECDSIIQSSMAKNAPDFVDYLFEKEIVLEIALEMMGYERMDDLSRDELIDFVKPLFCFGEKERFEQLPKDFFENTLEVSASIYNHIESVQNTNLSTVESSIMGLCLESLKSIIQRRLFTENLVIVKEECEYEPFCVGFPIFTKDVDSQCDAFDSWISNCESISSQYTFSCKYKNCVSEFLQKMEEGISLLKSFDSLNKGVLND